MGTGSSLSGEGLSNGRAGEGGDWIGMLSWCHAGSEGCSLDVGGG